MGCFKGSIIGAATGLMTSNETHWRIEQSKILMIRKERREEQGEGIST